MAIIRVSDLPKKETLDGTDRIVGYSTTGGTSLLFAQSFIDIKTAAETSARNAKASETSAQSQTAEITQKISQAKTDLSNLKTEGVNAINSAKSAGVNEVNSAKTTAVSAVNSAKTSGVAAVSDAQSSATGEVDKAKASAVSAVQNQESASIANLKASGDVLFVGRTELETALKELIVEFGGQVPA